MNFKTYFYLYSTRIKYIHFQYSLELMIAVQLFYYIKLCNYHMDLVCLELHKFILQIVQTINFTLIT
jgi:hypothetical protein